MEILGLLVIGFIIYGLFKNSNKPSQLERLASQGMADFRVRLKKVNIDSGDVRSSVYEVQGRGLFPIRTSKTLAFVTSVFDETEDGLIPVLSVLENLQEPDNITFQHKMQVGRVHENQGISDWVRIGLVVPEILVPPYGGNRKLVVVTRMIDINNSPEITQGFLDSAHSGLLGQYTLNLQFDFTNKGYLEVEEHRDEAMSLSLKIGVAIAMADGSLDSTEGYVLKNWVERAIAPYTGERREELKSLYNRAMQSAYSDLKSGQLSLSELTTRLNEIGEKSIKYETIDLCFSVMAADGVADPAELRTINTVAKALELDLNEIEQMRDKAVLKLDARLSETEDFESLLGIQKGWSNDQVKTHLRREFQKWNNRLNTLPEGDERDNAQKTLDLIAEARKRYG